MFKSKCPFRFLIASFVVESKKNKLASRKVRVEKTRKNIAILNKSKKIILADLLWNERGHKNNGFVKNKSFSCDASFVVSRLVLHVFFKEEPALILLTIIPYFP